MIDSATTSHPASSPRWLASALRFARAHWPILPLLGVYLALALVYGAMTPLWEAPDEPEHLEYARYLVEHRSFPTVPLRSVQIEPNDESGQSPLYYAVVAVVTRRLDFAGLALIQRNPYQKWAGHPAQFAMVESTLDSGWPWRGATLAGHRARMVSAGFGLLAVIATYAMAALLRRRGGPSPALAAALLALNPAFLFSSGTINNDAAVAGTGAIVILVCVWLMGEGIRGNRPLAPYLLGFTLGLALLAKANAVLLAPFSIAAIAVAAGSLRRALVDTLKAALACALVSGWWFAWNVVVFGTPVRKEAERLLTLSGSWTDGFSPALLGVRLWSIYRSSWGLFGWANVEMPTWVYVTLGGCALLALAGLGWRARIERWWRPSRGIAVWLWLALLLLAACGSVLGRGIVTAGIGTDHARFTYPAAAASALLLAAGLEWLAARSRIRLLPIAVAGLLGVLAAIAPWAYIAPSYPAPLPVWRGVDPPALASGATVARFGGSLILADVTVPKDSRPGDAAQVALYWRVARAPEGDLHAFVHVLDASGKGWTQSDHVPAGAAYPPSGWRSGDLVEDRHTLQLPVDMPTGSYRLMTGLYEWPSLKRVPVLSSPRLVVDNAVWAANLDVLGEADSP